MTHYEIRIQSPDGQRTIVWDVERPDDIAALNAAMDVCRSQTIEVWAGRRQVGAISANGQPRVTF